MASLRSLTSALRAPLTSQARLSATRHQFLAASHPSSNGARAYHAGRASLLPYKNDQDRESLRPQSAQTTGSSTDEAAAQSDAAFDPSTTRPEDEKHAAAKEGSGDRSDGGGNPLEVSGANHERSKPQGEDGGEEMKGTTKNAETGKSGGGSPEKRGKPRV